MSKYSIPVCTRLRFLLTFSRYSEIRVLVFGILLHIQKWHSLFSRQITRIYSELVCWFHRVFCVATYRLCPSFGVSFSLPFFEACGRGNYRYIFASDNLDATVSHARFSLADVFSVSHPAVVRRL